MAARDALAWALDLGTTNSLLARWDAVTGRPHVVSLPEICRGGEDPLGAPKAIPSAIHALAPGGLADRMARAPWLAGRVWWGRWGLVGRPALEKNVSTLHPPFARGFKRWLGLDPLRPLARLGDRSLGARDAARIFLREVLADARESSGATVRTLAVAAPVDAYEAYRAEVGAIARSLGVREITFVDEPVAAAAGYGLGLAAPRRVLVVDFGGGTLDLALAEITPRGAEAGRCQVMAKAGRPIGGDLVDNWVAEAALERADLRVPVDGGGALALWRRMLVDEARRVKEGLYFREIESLLFHPPEGYRAPEGSDAGEQRWGRADLESLLEERGLFRALGGALEEVLAAGPAPEEVLLVGGSTLLPGMFPRLAERFGRDRIRAWQPFEAVVHGACAIAAGALRPADHIVHDYAMVIHAPDTGARDLAVIVPRGTRFPTAPDFWRRRLVPTCARGEPERVFKLEICEVGAAPEEGFGMGFAADGGARVLSGMGERLVVPLNAEDPVLGNLDPPHRPGDRAARLEVAFGVNADRWLCATVRDLKTEKLLLDGRPVVRLL